MEIINEMEKQLRVMQKTNARRGYNNFMCKLKLSHCAKANIQIKWSLNFTHKM